MRGTELICSVIFGFYLVGTVLCVVGVVFPNWAEVEVSEGNTYDIGIWVVCSDIAGTDKCQSVDLYNSEGWFRSTVGMMILGLMCALVSGPMMMYIPVAAVLQAVAGIFILVGAGIFGVTVQEDDDAKIALCGSKTRLDQLAGVSNTYDTEIDLAWAFGLVAAAGAIFLVNGIALSVMAGCDNCSMQRFLPCHRNCFRAQDNYRERKGSAWWQFRRRNPYEDQHRPSVAYPSAPRQSVYPNNFLPVAASVPGYPSNSVPRYGYTNGTSPYAYGH